MAVQGLHSRQAMPSSLTIAISPSPPSSVVQVVALRGSACRAINGSVEIAHNLTGSLRINSVGAAPRDAAFNGRGSQIVVHGRSGRSAMYGDAETYVLMEPGEDEQFVTAEELQEKLKNWLQEWPGEKPPIDLTKFKNVDEAVQFLVNAVCELNLGDGLGSLQWYELIFTALLHPDLTPSFMLKNPGQGAATQVYIATNPRLYGVSGKILHGL